MWPSWLQPMGCWTGRGLQSREGRDAVRRWFTEASVFEERNCVTSRAGLGAELRIRNRVYAYCTCMCVRTDCTPLAWASTWLACRSHQQSDSSEADASPFITHSGAADSCTSHMKMNRQYGTTVWQTLLVRESKTDAWRGKRGDAEFLRVCVLTGSPSHLHLCDDTVHLSHLQRTLRGVRFACVSDEFGL